MQFYYTASNTEGKQLNGVINAATEAEAREQLNNLGFSILEIKANETPQEEKKHLDKYEFDAFDRNGKQVKGTIPAKTPLLAYKRLADEYHFTITSLYPQSASEEEKALQRQTGIEALKNQYELEKNQKPITQESGLTEDPKFLAEKDALIQGVDRILSEVTTLLSRFETKISPQKRAEIEGIIDKLGRIKSSNNLDYIRHTSNELLKKVQEDEIFLSEMEHEKERRDVIQKSQRMMLELSQKSAEQVDLSIQVKNSLEKAEKKLKGTSLAFLLNPLQSLRNLLTDPPDVERLKIQHSALRHQAFEAIKIAIKTPKPLRASAWENVKEIRERAKEIKKDLNEIKHRRDDSNLIIKKRKHIFFLEELNVFTGWLLFFYLMYYFIGHYVTTRGLSLRPFLGIPFDMSHSVLFKYLLSISFLIHSGLSLKLNFFLRNKTASIILIPSIVILSLLTIFNV